MRLLVTAFWRQALAKPNSGRGRSSETREPLQQLVGELLALCCDQMVLVSLKRGKGPHTDHPLPQTDHVFELFHERDVLW